MKELEDFYNNHYKTTDMMDWSELTEKQKKALENSREYWSYQLSRSIDDFRRACSEEAEKFIEIVNRFR